MEKTRRTWFVVADGEHARVLAHRADSGFEDTFALDSAAAHRRARELGADRPGRVNERADVARHAVDPRSDPHRRAKTDFAQVLAEEIVRARREGAFDRLALVAPPPILAAIKQHLDAECEKRLERELAKDLTKLPEEELRRRLAELGAGH
jgi:protein required for attachment to host cells